MPAMIPNPARAKDDGSGDCRNREVVTDASRSLRGPSRGDLRDRREAGHGAVLQVIRPEKGLPENVRAKPLKVPAAVPKLALVGSTEVLNFTEKTEPLMVPPAS